MAITMESIAAGVGGDLYARDQWGRIWKWTWLPGTPITGTQQWVLLPPPPDTVWVDPGEAVAR